MKNFEELQAKIVDWAEEKDLLHEENSNKQFMKFIEEVFEFKTKYDFFKSFYNREFKNRQICLDLERSLKIEMGDVFVTLIILCEQLNVSPQTCLAMAYDKIKARKGKTINGTFVKEEDL